MSFDEKKVRSLEKRCPNNCWLRQSYCPLLKQYNKLKKKLNEVYNGFISQINSLNSKDSKTFWRSLNKIKNINNQPSNPIQDKDWVNYYKSLFNPTTNVVTHSLCRSEQDKDNKCSLYFLFTCKEVKRGILKL